jgi:hypothetical protein
MTTKEEYEEAKLICESYKIQGSNSKVILVVGCHKGVDRGLFKQLEMASKEIMLHGIPQEKPIPEQPNFQEMHKLIIKDISFNDFEFSIRKDINKHIERKVPLKIGMAKKSKTKITRRDYKTFIK